MNTSHDSFQDEDIATIKLGAVVSAHSFEKREQQREQDKYEFRTFYEANLGLVYRYIYTKVGNREEAEDLTSQVFIKAMRTIDFSRDRLSMQKWLFQVARTTIIDYWRVYYRISTSSLEELLDAGWEGPAETDQIPAGATPSERVQYILQALPENQRGVLTCRFLLNLSIKETALSMGLTESNVKVLQFRALKRAADIEVSSYGHGIRREATTSERDHGK